MQAIIMAAGKGSRLKSITENKPKSFIQLKGQKLIDYNIKLLNKYGIKDIIIVTPYATEITVVFFCCLNVCKIF